MLPDQISTAPFPGRCFTAGLLKDAETVALIAVKQPSFLR